MAKQDVLARVEQDIERGHTHLALQRLAALAAEQPDDLEIRAVLGAISHRVGDFAEAGRSGCGCLAVAGVIVLIGFAVYGFLAFFRLL